MILKAANIEEKNGRRPYDLEGSSFPIRHFVTRVTTPEAAFRPHKHAQPELWFIIAGEAQVTLDDTQSSVSEGDLIVLEPWVEHGLRTKSYVKWLCLG